MELLKLLFGNFIEVLGRLLSGYFSAGWPFAAMHGLVFFAVVYNSWFKKIRTETEALKHWTPGGANTRKGETTPVLDRFVEDSEYLGPQGILVPMTDYSDRLDSSVDGMMSELHDRINLFLLVGIAGTLFGLFEFAFRAYDALTSSAVADNDRIRLLGEYLSLSMSKAFPVGFIGLVLTFLFQIRAAGPERRLRESLSVATRKALSRRKEVSQSQFSVVHETAGVIRESLQPLKDLEHTLTESIKPVIEEFGTRLDPLLDLVKTQFDEMQKSAASLNNAVNSVNTGVVSLDMATESLSTLLKDAPNVFSNTVKLQEAQLATLKDFEKVLEGYVVQADLLNLAVNNTLSNLIKLPDDVVRETKAVLDGLGKDSLSAWSDSSKDFYDLLSHDYENLFDDIGTRVEKIQGQVASVSKDLQAVTEGLGKTVTGLSDLPASIDSQLKATFVNVGTESKNAWVDMSNDFGRDTQKEFNNYLGNIQQQAENATSKLIEGAEEFNRVASTWETWLKVPTEKIINEAKESITAELKKLDEALVERYPLVSAKIEAFNTSLETMLGQVQSIQAGLTLWVQDADKAQKKVHDIHEGLVVADLLQNNTEHVKTANHLLTAIQSKIPASNDGAQAELTEIRRLLREIRSGIDAMASKTIVKKRGLFGRIRDRF